MCLCIFFTDRPRTPEVVIHAPMEKKGASSKPPMPAPQNPPSFQPPAQPTTRNPQPPAPAPAPPIPPAAAAAAAVRAPPGPSLPSQNNVMQPRSASSMNPPPRVGAPGPSPSMTNCDISNTTDNTAMFQMPNHQPPLSRLPQPPQPQPRGRSREPQPLAHQPMFQVTSNKGQLPARPPRLQQGRLGKCFLYSYAISALTITDEFMIFFLPLFKGFLDLPYFTIYHRCQLAELFEIIRSAATTTVLPLYKKYLSTIIIVLKSCPLSTLSIKLQLDISYKTKKTTSSLL